MGNFFSGHRVQCCMYFKPYVPLFVKIENLSPQVAHRLKVHGNKLFYCDVCQIGEKGAKGFEKIEDVVKHVVKENGLDPNDKRNIHEMIRCPGEAEFLKVGELIIEKEVNRYLGSQSQKV